MRSLTLAYALAGADCIDVAADPAVIAAAQDGLSSARRLMKAAQTRGYEVEELPWLMVSLNDGEDPHFRKAEFDAALCPETCPRPCEAVCPVQAIVFEADQPADQTVDSLKVAEQNSFSGVIESLCYGCGRCLTICPIENITARSYVSTPAAVAPLVLAGVDAVEIHTQTGRLEHFRRLWQAILPYVNQLKLISISCPDGEGLTDYLWSLYDLMAPLPCALIWQTDGRPMSGDIGEGATRAAIRLGQKVLAAGLPGHVQLAGGTNHHTVSKLKVMGLIKHRAAQKQALQSGRPYNDAASLQPYIAPYIAGVAYGSYARAILSPVLDQLEPPLEPLLEPLLEPPVHPPQSAHLSTVPSPPELAPAATMPNSMPISAFNPAVRVQLEDNLDLLWQAVAMAHSLVADLKLPNRKMFDRVSDSVTGSRQMD